MNGIIGINIYLGIIGIIIYIGIIGIIIYLGMPHASILFFGK